MPQARTQTRSKRGQSAQEKFSAELSSSQLVIGICILLLFGLACFLVGVLVGKFETAPRVAQVAQQQPPSPRTVVLPPPDPEPEPEPAPVVVAPVPEPEPVPPAQPDPSPEPRPKPVPVEPPEPVVSTTPDPEPEPTPEPEPEHDPVPLTPIEPSEDLSADPAPTPGPAVASSADGRFTVQIGAFSKQTYAQEAKKRIEAATGWPVYLVDSPERNLVMVHAGHFDTREDAGRAQTRLVNELGYSGSYVTEHSLAFTQAPS